MKNILKTINYKGGHFEYVGNKLEVQEMYSRVDLNTIRNFTFNFINYLQSNDYDVYFEEGTIVVDDCVISSIYFNAEYDICLYAFCGDSDNAQENEDGYYVYKC